MRYLQLLIYKPTEYFAAIDHEELKNPYVLIIAFWMISANIQLVAEFIDADLNVIIFQTIIGILLLLWFAHQLYPRFLRNVAKLLGGNASVSETRIIISTAFIPLIPLQVFESITQLLDSRLWSSQFVISWIFWLIYIRILIVGLAHYNRFSYKHAVATLALIFLFIVVIKYFLGTLK